MQDNSQASFFKRYSNAPLDPTISLFTVSFPSLITNVPISVILGYIIFIVHNPIAIFLGLFITIGLPFTVITSDNLSIFIPVNSSLSLNILSCKDDSPSLASTTSVSFPVPADADI